MPDSWSIPAKTFLMGEYAALDGKSALLLTTNPCFELRTCTEPGLHGIHPHSPAGRWWTQAGLNNVGFIWHDPYQGLGGMGASTAQFLTVYQAVAHLRAQSINSQTLLNDYWAMVTSPNGIRPSGYDLLAQQQQGCVFLNREQENAAQYTWPFSDLGFILVHTQKKLATHEHLQTLVLNTVTEQLSALVDHAHHAFISGSSYHLVETVKAYHQLLVKQHWVATHTLNCIQRLYQETDALAIKGCGAMGADVILLLVKQHQLNEQVLRLKRGGWYILATNKAIYSACSLTHLSAD
jgi:mevalonate kinase